MNPIDSDMTLAALVTERPELAGRLDALGLDFCCGGQRRLVDAITEAGLDHGDAIDALQARPPQTQPVDWNRMGMLELTAHIESTHHVYLGEALPRIDALAAKVAGVHRARHPELDDVAGTVTALRAELEPHLLKEEQVLFPMIRELASATEPPSFHCGTLRNPIGAMTTEHERAGELLSRLRVLTDDYTVPDDGCASYRALYDGLVELEGDTHLHVHKENNLLFPAAVDAEQALVRSEATIDNTDGSFVVDLGTHSAPSDGAVWSLPHGGDLDGNLVRLAGLGSIGEHRNYDVDVLVFVRSGRGTVTIDGTVHDLGPDHLAVIPKGAARSIAAGPSGISYLSVHRRRTPLGIGPAPTAEGIDNSNR